MQRLLQHFQVGALFAIAILSVVQAGAATGSTTEIAQACQLAQRKMQIHEPAALIECHNQKLFPRKKRALLDARIGLLEERVRTFSEKSDKAPTLASLDERLVTLKKRRGIESELEPRLLMAPIERAKYDKKRLVDLRKSLVQLKKQLGQKQKELAHAYGTLFQEERQALNLKQISESKYSRHGLQSKIWARQKHFANLKNKLAKTSKKTSVPDNVNSIIKDIQQKLSTTQKGLYALKKRLAKAPQMSEKVQENLYQLIASPRKIETVAHSIINKHGQPKNRKTRRNHNMGIRS